MYNRQTDSGFELIHDERGKTWRVMELRTLAGPHGKRTTPRLGFEHDRYTFAPDPPDVWPAIGHDYGYDIDGAGRKWDDGTPMTRKDVDEMLRNLMACSDDEKTRKLANLYYVGVRVGGWVPWMQGSWRKWRRERKASRKACRHQIGPLSPA